MCINHNYCIIIHVLEAVFYNILDGDEISIAVNLTIIVPNFKVYKYAVINKSRCMVVNSQYMYSFTVLRFSYKSFSVFK